MHLTCKWGTQACLVVVKIAERGVQYLMSSTVHVVNNFMHTNSTWWYFFAKIEQRAWILLHFKQQHTVPRTFGSHTHKNVKLLNCFLYWSKKFKKCDSQPLHLYVVRHMLLQKVFLEATVVSRCHFLVDHNI